MKMKRVLSVLIVLLVVFGVSGAALGETISVDPATATLDELIAARTAIEQAIMSRDDYKEVKVPAGTYTVGNQIPAGEYTVSAGASLSIVTVYGKGGKEAFDMAGMHTVTGAENIGRLVLEDGQTVEITGSVVFAPYAGLGF